MLKFKDTTDRPLISMLVYKYEFNRYNSIYIAKKSFHLCNHVSKHKWISFRSGFQLNSPPFSSIRRHLYNNLNKHPNYIMSNKEFNILDTASSEVDLLRLSLLSTLFLKKNK